MLNKVVSGVGTLSLVGAPVACANSADVAQSKEEKAVDFLMDVVSSKKELSQDEIYEKLVDIFSVKERGSLNIKDIIEKFSSVYMSYVPHFENKFRTRKFFDVFKKFCSEQFKKLDKNADTIAKAKSLYKLKKACIDAYVGDRSSELPDYLEKTLTKGGCSERS